MKIQELEKSALDLAIKFVGVHEQGGNNRGPEVEMFQSIIGKPVDQPWCMDFVQYCVRTTDKKLGSKTLLFPSESVHITWKKTPESCRSMTPVPGSVICWLKYKGENPTSLGHCGIVKEILDKDWMITIEGNTGPGVGVVREGDGVYLKRRLIRMKTGSMRTLGYIRPWGV